MLGVFLALKVMIDPNSPASTRVRAADSVLDHAAKAIEIEDLEVRLEALEQSAGLGKPGAGDARMRTDQGWKQSSGDYGCLKRNLRSTAMNGSLRRPT